MKMEIVHEQLKRWGELLVTTAAGQTFELHLGDTHFDYDKRVFSFRASGAEFIIDGDCVESIQMHFSSPERD
ncbi:MAG TPA: hypothetical protein VIL08_03680 [Limnochorda sp.]